MTNKELIEKLQMDMEMLFICIVNQVEFYLDLEEDTRYVFIKKTVKHHHIVANMAINSIIMEYPKDYVETAQVKSLSHLKESLLSK